MMHDTGSELVRILNLADDVLQRECLGRSVALQRVFQRSQPCRGHKKSGHRPAAACARPYVRDVKPFRHDALAQHTGCSRNPLVQACHLVRPSVPQRPPGALVLDTSPCTATSPRADASTPAAAPQPLPPPPPPPAAPASPWPPSAAPPSPQPGHLAPPSLPPPLLPPHAPAWASPRAERPPPWLPRRRPRQPPLHRLQRLQLPAVLPCGRTPPVRLQAAACPLCPAARPQALRCAGQAAALRPLPHPQAWGLAAAP